MWNLPECRRLSEKFAKTLVLCNYLGTFPSQVQDGWSHGLEEAFKLIQANPWGKSRCYGQVASGLGDLALISLGDVCWLPSNCVVRNGYKNSSGRLEGGWFCDDRWRIFRTNHVTMLPKCLELYTHLECRPLQFWKFFEMRRLGRKNWCNRLKIQWDMLSGNPSQSISGAPTRHSCWKNNVPISKRGPDKWRSTKKWGWKLKIPPPPKSHKKNQTTCLPISSSSPTSKTPQPPRVSPSQSVVTQEWSIPILTAEDQQGPATPYLKHPGMAVSHPGWHMTYIFRFREIPT